MYISTMPASYPLPQPMTSRQATLGAYRSARATQLMRIQRSRRRTLGSAQTTGEQIGVNAAATAVQVIPVAGQVIGAVIKLVGSWLIGKHIKAMKVEGQTLNANNPNFLVTVQQTMAALNAGSMSESQAIAALQQALSDYYSSVSSIIKHSGSCTSNCSYLPQSNCNKLSTCNAACIIGCINANTVAALTQMINSGGGTYSIPATPNNGLIQGTPAFDVSYTASGLASVTSGTLGGMPTWVWLAGGGVLLFVLFSGRS